jgi:hypothetical protein
MPIKRKPPKQVRIPDELETELAKFLKKEKTNFNALVVQLLKEKLKL